MGLRPQDPDTLDYEALLEQGLRQGEDRGDLSRNIHHVLVYPGLSVQSPLQQLRACGRSRPDKTLSEIWHFRLKGAPEAIYRRSLWYYNLVNSPATMINADDLENWTKGQWGLMSERRRLGELSPLLRRRPRRERRDLFQPRHVGSGDAQPVQCVDRSTSRLEGHTMSNTKAIPTAGPDFEHLLAQDVVIEAASDGAAHRRAGRSRARPFAARAPGRHGHVGRAGCRKPGW